jgi:hypothetical protein
MRKVFAAALVVAGLGAAVAPAMACDSCSRVIDSSMVVPVVDTTITQPAVIETTPMVSPIIRTEPIYTTPMRRDHLLRLDTPFFGIHLF